jgi:hypothetical protein
MTFGVQYLCIWMVLSKICLLCHITLTAFLLLQATWLHAAHERSLKSQPTYLGWAEPVSGAPAESGSGRAPHPQQAAQLPETAAEAAPEQFAREQGASQEGKTPASEALEGLEGDDSDDDADLLGPDDWDDILSAWMGAVGLSDKLGGPNTTPSASAAVPAPALEPGTAPGQASSTLAGDATSAFVHSARSSAWFSSMTRMSDVISHVCSGYSVPIHSVAFHFIVQVQQRASERAWLLQSLRQVWQRPPRKPLSPK